MALVLVGGMLGFSLMSSKTAAPGPPIQAHPRPAPAVIAAPATPQAPVAPAESSTVEKDPFHPLVESVIAAPAAPVAAPVPAPAPAAPPAAPAPIAVAAPVVPAAAPVVAVPATPPAAAAAITLVDTFFDSKGATQASVQPSGGAPQVVTVGQVFGGDYKLSSVDGPCATFLKGADTFTLCAGQTGP